MRQFRSLKPSSIQAVVNAAMDVKSIVNLAQTQRALTAVLLTGQMDINKTLAEENARLKAEGVKLKQIVTSMAIGLTLLNSFDVREDPEETVPILLGLYDSRFELQALTSTVLDGVERPLWDELYGRNYTHEPVTLKLDKKDEDKIVAHLLSRV